MTGKDDEAREEGDNKEDETVDDGDERVRRKPSLESFCPRGGGRGGGWIRRSPGRR
jgi:hypothetical protein